MATDMFLEISEDELKGESGDVKHKDTIEISSWSTSYEQPASPAKTATGPSVERCKAEPITVAKIMDASTPGLLKRIWSGKLIPKAIIHCYRADDAGKPVKYLMIEMLHVLVTTYSLGGAEGDLPQEELGLSVGQVTYHYDVQKKEGGGTGAKKAQCNFITGKID